MAIAVNRIWGNGLATSGPALPQYSPWIQSSPSNTNVVWVDSTSTASADGTEDRPYTTFLSAYNDADLATAESPIIIVKASHTETISAALTMAKAGLTVIGLGEGATKPSFINATAAAYMWTVNAARVRFYNLQFPASSAASTGRIDAQQTDPEFYDCDFYCGTNDTANTLNITGQNPYLEGVTFTSQGSAATRPGYGVQFNTINHTSIHVRDCTWNGGSAGWSIAALKINGAANDFRIVNSTVTGPTLKFSIVTGSTGWIAGYTPGSNQPQIDWPI